MKRIPTAAAMAVIAVLSSGCQRSAQDRVGCGIAAVAAPSVILGEFGVSGATMAGAPTSIPHALPVRVAAGKAYRGTVSKNEGDTTKGTERGVTVRIDGGEKVAVPGFGVLVVDKESQTIAGIMLFTGPPLDNAPILGQVMQDTVRLPLVGLRMDLKKISATTCPIFPDSLRI